MIEAQRREHRLREAADAAGEALQLLIARQIGIGLHLQHRRLRHAIHRLRGAQLLGLRVHAGHLRCGRGLWVCAQPPHGHADRQDHGARVLQEQSRAIAGHPQCGADARAAVGRQLQHHGPRGAAQDGASRKQRAQQARHGAGGVAADEGHRGEPWLAREQQRDQQHIHRQSRGAAHEGRHQDGGQPIARIRNQSCAQNAGQRARMTRQQRHERLTRQSKASHEAVGRERGARQIAAVFKQTQQEEQQRDLRQEHHGARHAAHHAIHQQVSQCALRQRGLQPAAQVREDPVDAVHGELGQPEDGREQQGHHHHEHRAARHRVRERGIHAIAQRVGADRVCAADAVGHGVAAPGCQRRIALVRWKQCKTVLEHAVGDALMRHAHGRRSHRLHALAGAAAGHMHGATQARLQSGRIHAQALAARLVGQRHRHHAGQAPSKRGHHEAQRLRQVGGVGDQHHHIGRAVADAALDALATHAAFRKFQMQPVGAGQVHHLHVLRAHAGQAHAALHRGARQVARARAHAAQAVEQRGLAGVGLPEQRCAQRSRCGTRRGAIRARGERHVSRLRGRRTASPAAGSPPGRSGPPWCAPPE